MTLSGVSKVFPCFSYCPWPLLLPFSHDLGLSLPTHAILCHIGEWKKLFCARNRAVPIETDLIHVLSFKTSQTFCLDFLRFLAGKTPPTVGCGCMQTPLNFIVGKGARGIPPNCLGCFYPFKKSVLKALWGDKPWGLTLSLLGNSFWGKSLSCSKWNLGDREGLSGWWLAEIMR